MRDAGEQERNQRRRWGAFLLLAIGLAVAFSSLGRSWPREQTVVFRLPKAATLTPTRLAITFTRVGEREPERGLAIALPQPFYRDVREQLHLPNGDYIVAAGITWTDTAGPSAPVTTETNAARRITLNGSETLVVLDAEGLE